MKQNLPNKQEKEPVKVLSLQDQETLIKEEIQKFLKLAKEKGALTIEEINDLLPPEIIAPAVLDA
ncbi:MAG TPA: RNA polymerase sigma factor region1.1 domain-containing protein, partial [Bdellovibrio sp.]|nr:RNA polymerase sigma factor region1.1 domain-containing protein [Bdellovibrio sp.]